MKYLQVKNPTRLAILLLAGAVSTTSIAAMPGGEFACQVTAEGGRIGLVLVQADSRALAEKAALGAQAFTMDNTRSRATRVVECIERGRERFADYQFQQFFESIPL